MNIDNLTEGLLIKNYKELITLLGEEVKSGNAKIRQMKDLEQYCTYHKEGNKFIIDKVFDNPIERLDNSKNSRVINNINKGEYSKEVFPLVKNFVGKNPDIEFCPKGKLMKLLRLKNDNYDLAFEYPNMVAEYLSDKLKIVITEDDINLISNSIYQNAHDKIHKAFNNLEKLNYISCYTNKLLTIYNNEHKQAFVPCEIDTKKMEATIYKSKRKALMKYFRINKTLDEYTTYMKELEELCEYNQDEIEKELNIQMFLRGLNKKVKDYALEDFKIDALSEDVENYFYSYAYIRNEDIEWDKEIIELAKENVHLENYKQKVKESFIQDSFIEKFFDEEYREKESSLIKKTRFRKGLQQHKKDCKEKVELLFDVFTSATTKIHIDRVAMFNLHKKLKEEKDKINEIL